MNCFFKLLPDELPVRNPFWAIAKDVFPEVKKIAMLLPGDDVGRMYLNIQNEELKVAGYTLVIARRFHPTQPFSGQLTMNQGKGS